MSSEKKIASNRANAAKSTGPRTVEGKQKSSLNAVKHGLTAQSSVLPGEDPALLEALSNSLMKQLKPRGVVQRLMAERIVSLAWKLRRVARAEEAVAREMEDGRQRRWKKGRDSAEDQPIFRQFVGPRPKPRDGGMLLADAMWERGERGTGEHQDYRLPRLTQYELKLDASLRAAMRELLKLQKEADAFEEVEEDDAGEAAPAQNEPNAPETVTATPVEEDPGLRSFDKLRAGCAAPAACGEGSEGSDERSETPSEAPVEKTNPTDEGEESTQVEAAPTVRPDSVTDSSMPAPETSASPPPAPRR